MFVFVLYKVENEFSKCYKLGIIVDIVIQAALIIADTSVNIN